MRYHKRKEKSKEKKKAWLRKWEGEGFYEYLVGFRCGWVGAG